MELYALPLDGKVLLYRPLARLAFVGNEAMARLAQVAAQAVAEGEGLDRLPPAAARFLAGIGFLEPDPPPPAPREQQYRPTTAVLLLTSRCSLRCVYCYAAAGQQPARAVSAGMARAAIDQVVRNARDLGHSHFELILHGGGEPTQAWNSLEQAVTYARAMDLPARISMVSNGVWTARQRDWIMDSFDRLTISCDGRRETQDRQRPLASGRGSFASVSRTLAELDRRGFDYGVRMTALAPWPERLARDVQFLCEATGCRSVQVEPAFNTERGVYQSPSAAEGHDFVAGFMEAYEVSQHAGRRLTYSGARPWLLTSSFCSAPYGSLIVTPSGDLVTCYEITSPEHPLAAACTVGRMDGSDLHLDHGKRAALLARLEARRAACRGCFCYWHCAGDCHAKALYPGADTAPGASRRCRVNQAITLEMLACNVARAPEGVWRGPRKSSACDRPSGGQERQPAPVDGRGQESGL